MESNPPDGGSDSGEFKYKSPRLNQKSIDSGENGEDSSHDSQFILDSGEKFQDSGEPLSKNSKDNIQETSKHASEHPPGKLPFTNQKFEEKINQIIKRKNLSQKKAQQRLRHSNLRKSAR